MKILIHNSDDVVLFAGVDITLSDGGGHVTDPTFNFGAGVASSHDSQIMDVDYLPIYFEPGLYKRVGNSWVVANQARYDELAFAAVVAATPPSDTKQFLAMQDRRAKALEAKGDQIGALLLRRKYEI